MTRTLPWLLALALVAPARSAETLETLDLRPPDPGRSALLTAGARSDGTLTLIVERKATSSPGPETLALATLSDPGVTARRYALRGELRYSGVEAGSYLEMWSHLSDGGSYFSRTLAAAGPLGRLQGTSDWRPFALPFDLGDSSAVPIRLEFNLYLAGRGRVELGPVSLVELEPGDELLSPTVDRTGWREPLLLLGLLAVPMAAGGAILLSRRRRRARELRQIEALDAG